MRFADFAPRQRFQPSLAVSPDGTQVAYSANTSGGYDLWLAHLDGSAPPHPVTDLSDRTVRDVAWTPDGAGLAFSADSSGDEQHQIFVVDADGSSLRRVSRADCQHQLGSSPFSGDGRLLAYAANDRDPMVQDLLIHDLVDDTVRRVESTSGVLLSATEFSLDSTRLLVGTDRSNTDGDVGVVDLREDDLRLDVVTSGLSARSADSKNTPVGWIGGGEAFAMIGDQGAEFSTLQLVDLNEREAVAFPESHESSWDVEWASTTPDGDTMVWTVNEAGTSVMFRSSGGTVTRHELGTGVIEAFDVTPDGQRAVALLTTATRPHDVVVIDLVDGAPVRHLTDSTPPAFEHTGPVEPDLVDFVTHDGRDIPGWLFRPVGDGPFPVVLSIHGGPEAQERPRYAYSGLYQYLLDRGVGVFAPNVRGSTGYGRTYQTLIHRDWGGDELRDFEYAHRFLSDLPWVAGDRIGVFGGSFGGFAALSCLARLPELWAAGVSVVGPSNLQTMVRAVPPTWRALMATWIGDPDEDAEFLAERSPLTYADDIVAPLMIVQGANDPRVPQSESDQIVASLRGRGVEVRYDLYGDEGHGFTSRDNEVEAIGSIADFLIAHLAR